MFEYTDDNIDDTLMILQNELNDKIAIWALPPHLLNGRTHKEERDHTNFKLLFQASFFHQVGNIQ